MKISGIADRAGSEIAQLGPDVDVPTELPIRIDFQGTPVGVAWLRRDSNGDILAEAEIVDPAARRIIREGTLDHFAVAVTVSAGDDRRVTRGLVSGLSIVERNIDPDQPPFTIQSEGEAESSDECEGAP